MSCYLLKEHLVLLDPEGDLGLPQMLKTRLLAFGVALMTRGNVHRCELALRVGKQLYAFAGTLPSPDFYALVQAISGTDLEFIGLCEYNWEPWWEQSLAADPFRLSRVFLRTGGKPGIFYSCYAGDQQDPGEIMAFGERNGRQYHGVVPWVELPRLPGRGTWVLPMTAVSYRTGSLRDLNVQRLVGICRELSRFSRDHVLKLTGEGFSFRLHCPKLKSGEALETYLALCGELLEVTAGKCRVTEEFVELSGPDPQMLMLDRQDENRLKITLL